MILIATRRWVSAALLAGTVATVAFFTGRAVEHRALFAKANSSLVDPPRAVAASEPPPPSHRQLTGAEIARLPFADFYEALRSAPGEAREKWASELADMPESPGRNAAVSGFYKLLVQFDPSSAVEKIGAIQDVGLQRLALAAAVNAVPGFALPEVAKLALSLQERIPDKRDYVSDVIYDWSVIDPRAAAQFIEENSEAFHDLSIGGRFIAEHAVVSAWAALDPVAAREWLERKGDWDEIYEAREAFIGGWYENDRAAAVAFAIEHADEPPMFAAIGFLTRALYHESKAEATKFIESLPEEKRAEALAGGFRNLVILEATDTDEPAMTPEAIATWMLEFPPAYWKGALGHLFQFSASGAAGMLAWIQQLPPALRGAAAAEYWPPLGESTSEQLAPLLQVADPLVRDQLLKGAIEIAKPDLEELKTTLANAPLSPAQKQHLLEIAAAAKAAQDTGQGSEK